MTSDQLLHPLLVATVFFIAAYLKFRQKKVEEVFSLLCVSAWFTLVYMYPDMDVETIRVISRYVLIQIPVVHIFFYFALWYYRKKYKQAMKDGGLEVDNAD